MLLLFRNRASGGGGIPAGMVARWTLDDQAAGYVDLVNGLTLTNSDPVNILTGPGIINNGADFPASVTNPNATLSVPDNVLLQNNGPGFAAECWFRQITNPALTGDAPLMVKLLPRGWDIYTTNSYRIRAYFTSSFFTTPNNVWTLNTWHHLAVAITAANFANVYVDGMLVATSPTAVSSTPAGAPLYIGSRFDSARFQGYIDEVAIWQFGASGDPGAAFWLARYNGGAGVRP